MAEQLKWSRPVAAGVVTARFGESGPNWTNKHTGIDFGVPVGTGVVAAADGKIKHAGWYSDAYGVMVILDHGSGIESWYAHLDATIATGSAEHTRGSLIAFSGKTGNVTGPHLHFEIRVNGTPVDPEPYISGRTPPALPGLPGEIGEIGSFDLGGFGLRAGSFVGGAVALGLGVYLLAKNRRLL